MIGVPVNKASVKLKPHPSFEVNNIQVSARLYNQFIRVWSKDELVNLFKVDINTFERGVLRLSPALASHQSKFDAVVSFAYNAGLGNYQRSTIRMKVNRGDWEGAAEAFMSWTKAGGKEVAGLVKRRKAEVALFLN